MTKRPASRITAKPMLGRRFEQAVQFALRKHASQTKKGTKVPYAAHLLGVASLVLEAGGDEDLAIAALLHDVVEDCGGAPMLSEVRRRFGKRVADVVEGCTDADTYPKPPWRSRKEEYLRHLRTADAGVRLLSRDRGTNLGTLPGKTRWHALVLSRVGDGISPQEGHPPDERTGARGDRTGNHVG